MNYELKCMVDLDGTLVNFNKKIEEITGKSSQIIKRGELWYAVQKYNDTVAPFFESLDWMSDGKKLWNFIINNFHNVQILSACGYTPTDAADQKRNWVAKNLGPNVVTKVVTSGSLKAQFATPNTILIDDTRKAIDPWIAAGGIGILHTSADSTIAQIEELIR